MTDARLVPRLRGLAAGLHVPGRRRVAALRRAAAAALTLLALVLALAPRTGVGVVPVVVLAADLPAGATLRAADLALRSWPAEIVPAGAVTATAAAEGRVLAGAAGAGEALTDARLSGAGPAAGPGGAAVPVRLADAGVAGLLSPGSHVDVVTVGGPTGDPVVLAADATVLAVLPSEAGSRGRLVMVAMPRGLAARVAAASLSEQLAVTLR